MLGALIHKSWDGRKGRADDVVFETTTFSLSTKVPRPTEQRADERFLSLLPIARLVTDFGHDLCRVRNISAGGVMAETMSTHAVGTKVCIEFNAYQQVPGVIVWTRDTSCGIKFDQNIDLRDLLANRPARRKGQVSRPPCLDITCNAELVIEGVLYCTQVKDISLGGLQVAISDWNCVNKNVVVRLESFRSVKGVICWYKAGYAGIVFKRPLSFKELAEWMGKRVEIASLKAGAWTKTRL